MFVGVCLRRDLLTQRSCVPIVYTLARVEQGALGAARPHLAIYMSRRFQSHRFRVVRGAGDGHRLGWPTMNLDGCPDLPDGVYCGRVVVCGSTHAAAMCVWPVGVDSMCTDWSWVWVASGRVLPVGSSVAAQRAMRVDIRRPALTWAGIVVATGCMFILTYMCRRLGSTAAVRRWTTRRRLMRRPRRTDITHEM